MSLTSLLLTPYTLLALPILYYLLPYLRARSLISIPGPPIAAFSNLWLLLQCRLARRYLSVDAAHARYGPIIRIAPNHISIADDTAIPLIYGHGNGFLKSDFYDAFVSIHRGLFNTRDRAQHSRKRKIVSHTFSPKSITQFEPYIRENLTQFVAQWDCISSQPPPSSSYAPLDALHWFNYLAFDIIGDLAFGAPFGMVSHGADIAEVRSSPSSPPTFAPAIEVLNRRGEVSATLGCLPALKPYAPYLPDPFFRKGVAAVQNLAGIAVARVKSRLDNPSAQRDRKDLLARLMQGKDDAGNPLGRDELTAEALTQLIAGSDTTSNTSCALLYHVLATPGVAQKLAAELDAALPAHPADPIPAFDAVKDLPYMNKVIAETLRIHSTSSLGLPRLIPPSSPPLTLASHTFPPGTVLSVPAYTIHHSTSIWGPSASTFDPERWDKSRLTERQKAAFIPFSTGPRACVGRNVAEMELALIVSTVFSRYEFELRVGDGEWRTREGFLRKPMGCKVGVRRRVRS